MTRADRITLSAIVLLLVAAAYLQVVAAFSGDKVWLLLVAREWLQGRTLYVDIFEVNPPLIIWLYAAPVWVSMHLPPLKDYQALGLAGLGLSALSAWLGICLIRLHPAFAQDKRGRIWFALLLLAIFIFFTRPAYFFDRDHVFFVLTFPYLLRFMPSLAGQDTGWRLRLGVGVLAAVGFCIKPHTIIVFAALQLLVCLKERSAAILTSVENLIIYLFSFIYLLCVWQFTPDYLRTVLPMALATYSAFSRRMMGVLYCIIAFTTAGVMLSDFSPRLATPYRRDVRYFLGLGLAFLAYALAGNGWGYTYHPLLSYLLFLAGWLGWEYGWLERTRGMQGESVKRFIFGRRACALVLLGNAAFMLYGIAVSYATPVCAHALGCKKALPYARYLEQHDVHSFGALSEDFHLWPWLARLSGARFETRYNALWMLPKLVLEGPTFAQEHGWIVKSVGRGFADDLNRRKPDVVFVDNSKSFFGTPQHVDLVAYFSAVPEFKEAWGHYRYVATIDNCATLKSQGNTECRHDIYSRNH